MQVYILNFPQISTETIHFNDFECLCRHLVCFNHLQFLSDYYLSVKISVD